MEEIIKVKIHIVEKIKGTKGAYETNKSIKIKKTDFFNFAFLCSMNKNVKFSYKYVETGKYGHVYFKNYYSCPEAVILEKSLENMEVKDERI